MFESEEVILNLEMLFFVCVCVVRKFYFHMSFHLHTFGRAIVFLNLFCVFAVTVILGV